jgi:hypothetical protein
VPIRINSTIAIAAALVRHAAVALVTNLFILFAGWTPPGDVGAVCLLRRRWQMKPFKKFRSRQVTPRSEQRLRLNDHTGPRVEIEGACLGLVRRDVTSN